MDIIIVSLIVLLAVVFIMMQALKSIKKVNDHNNQCSCDCKNCSCKSKETKLI